MKNRAAIVANIRGMMRLVDVKPFSDSDILREVENGIDDFSNRCPFAVAIDRAHGVKNQRELILPFDVLEIIEVHYMNAAGTTLTSSITASNPPTPTNELSVGDTTDFPTTGTLLIDDEQITYTGKTTGKFTGITRGANSTTATTHSAGAGVIEADVKFTILEPSTNRDMVDDDTNWLSAEAGTPESYYTYPGVLGFNVAPDKSGYFNVVLRNLIRPPALSADSSVVQGLLASFDKAIESFAAAKLALSLAQDDSSALQAKTWMQEYLNDINMFKKRDLLYLRGQRPQITPFRGRPTGFV